VTPPRRAEVEVDEVTGAGSAASVVGRRGGGWRALLADVLGEPGSATSALLSVLSDPPERAGRWGEEELDEIWRLAHADAPATSGQPALTPASLVEVG
jgi:hypothetical protein